MDEHEQLVLLADSDGVVCLDLVDALERAGYRVAEACVTAEALSLLEQETPHLAILDPLLRDGGCSELAAALRQRDVPFLVHSALQPDEPLAQDLLGTPWLSKPASPAEVIYTLEELLTPRATPVPPLRLVEPLSAPRVLRQSAPSNPFIRKLESFTGLSDEERALLKRISANPRTVGAHVDLVHEGDAPEGVFLVMSGIACRHKLRSNGARQITAYLLPGDLCDLDVALLDRMDHTITTLAPCTVVRIAPETIAELMQRPRIARALRMGTLVDEATLREWLVNVGCRSALERIAHLFCELFERLREVGLTQGDSCELPLRQGDLADTTGLSSVHVNRTLQAMRRAGLIEFQDKRLRIPNLPALRAVGDFKPNYLHLGNRSAA